MEPFTPGLLAGEQPCWQQISKGNWVTIEQYITSRIKTLFSHSLSPECLARQYGRDE